MITPDTEPRHRSDARLGRLSKEVLRLLAERGTMPVEGLGDLLRVPPEQAGMAAGWLVRSRVVDALEEPDGRLTLRLPGPFA